MCIPCIRNLLPTNSGKDVYFVYTFMYVFMAIIKNMILPSSHRELKMNTFMSELKANKARSVCVLTKLPHIIPHRKVSSTMYVQVLTYVHKYIDCRAVLPELHFYIYVLSVMNQM